MRYILIALALAGCIVSALALQVHYSNDVQPCDINEHWDCGIVNHSPFAEIAHVPVAAIGIAGYLLLAPLCFFRIRKYLLLGCLVGLGFSLYLTHIEKDVLHVWCIYCVVSFAIITLMTLLSLAWAFASRKKSS